MENTKPGSFEPGFFYLDQQQNKFSHQDAKSTKKSKICFHAKTRRRKGKQKSCLRWKSKPWKKD